MTGALILAGGLSERMGKPKAFLKIGTSNFLEKIISVYRKAGVDKVLIVLNGELFNHPSLEKLKNDKKVGIIPNYSPELGRFYSIKTGLHKIFDIDFCFIQNIDNPFITIDLIKMLKKVGKDGAYSVPVFNGKGGHPVLISKEIINYIKGFKGNDYNFRELLNGFERIEVEVDQQAILWNINTLKDYRKFVINN